ncbi:2-dehydropantoate 2-reductase [Candidatus Bathyarchaeota archaeon]|nr:MAG: 2-dehydropantoate 2-reductase [Candidatus Bathyarchaeota archaeon]
MLQIGIVGAGAIGTLFGGLLQRAGNDVTLVHRDPRVVSAIRKKGVRIREGRKTVRATVRASRAPADLTTADVVFFTVKAYDTRQAAGMHKGRVGKRSAILSIQNGLGNLETLADVFKSNPVLAGSTTEAALALGPGLVLHAGRGHTQIGTMQGRVQVMRAKVVQELSRAGLPAKSSSDMSKVIWEKTILNSAINPISAITRLQNGEILKILPLRELMRQVIREGAAIGRAEWIPIDSAGLWRNALRILKATAKNRSSMLQDIMHERMTEILQLNGTLAEYGAKHHLAIHLNRALTSLVRGIEMSYS